jgi:hypothetical protein
VRNASTAPPCQKAIYSDDLILDLVAGKRIMNRFLFCVYMIGAQSTFMRVYHDQCGPRLCALQTPDTEDNMGDIGHILDGSSHPIIPFIYALSPLE